MSDLDKLMEKVDETIRKDINHLFGEACQGKLSPASARDLVQYKKLLLDTLNAQERALEALPQQSTEDLKALAHELLTERS
jgi:hypothetical protein